MGHLAFLPLFQSPMMMLPSFFELCDFTPVLLKQRLRFPLLLKLLGVFLVKQLKKIAGKLRPMGKDIHTLHHILSLSFLITQIQFFNPVPLLNPITGGGSGSGREQAGRRARG